MTILETEHIKEIESLKKDLINLKNDMTFLKKKDEDSNYDSVPNNIDVTMHEESITFL
jgi:hypothetical protein